VLPPTTKRDHRTHRVDWHNTTCRVEITGDLVEFKTSLIDYKPPRSKKGRRISTFSRASRLRMLKRISTINWRGIKQGLFITVTYPDECLPRTKDERSRDRYLFFRHIENYLGKNTGAIWRVEWKVRKSGKRKDSVQPHMHAILFGASFVPHQKIREFWRSTIGVTGPLATDVAPLTDKRMHAVYVAKYAAKMPELPSLDYALNFNIDGQHWGTHRRDCVPVQPTETFHDLGRDARESLQALAARTLTDYRPEEDAGFSLLGVLGEKLKNAVRQICLDNGVEPSYDTPQQGGAGPEARRRQANDG